jgi:hypothetical protein
MGEPAEPGSVQPHCQRLIRCHEHINPHIKLLATNKQRVHNVLLNHIRLSLWRIRLLPKVGLPLSNLLQLIKQEDAFALRFANRFHDPDAALLFELFNEKRVVAWETVCERVEVVCVCVLKLAFFLVLFLLPLEVLNH